MAMAIHVLYYEETRKSDITDDEFDPTNGKFPPTTVLSLSPTFTSFCDGTCQRVCSGFEALPYPDDQTCVLFIFWAVLLIASDIIGRL